MKQKLLFYVLIFFVGLNSCAILAQQTIDTSGQNATGTGGSVSYSVGQIVYITNLGTNGSVAQGVQQPYEISVVLGIHAADAITILATLFPNPTTDFVTLKVANYEFETLTYQLYDAVGKQFLTGQTATTETQIMIGNLPSAIYFLKISDKNTALKTFKIIKN